MKKSHLCFCIAGLCLLAAGCSLEQPCKEQALKCETDSTTQRGIRYTCIDGAWLNPEEGNSCKDDENWGECNNGAQKCDEGGIKTCEKGMWSAPDDSCMGRGCLNDKECAACSDGEILCNPETSAYKMCWSGNWFPYETPCESGKCSEDRKSCAEKLDCTEEQVECFEGTLKTCGGGHWVTSSCPDNGACKLDNTGCAECAAGETQCKDGVLKICVNESWIESKTCACKDDKSCAECTSGQSQCDSLKSHRECTDINEWGASQACLSNQNCVIAGDGRASCTDEPVSCMDGVKQCIGDMLYVCNSNAWNEEKDCKYGCNAETGACNECQNGDTNCFDGVLKTCVNHVWSNPTTCKGIACVDEHTCANCVVGVSCENNNQSVGTITECYDAKTQTQSNCDGVSCNSDKTMCGVCKNGAQKCENGDDKIGIPSICMNGNWEGGNICAGDVSCKGSVCGQCRNNTKKCENNKEYICSEGDWVAGESCVNGCNAEATACVPSDVCSNGEEKCVEGMKYTCHANVWSGETACTGGVSCRNETTCGECKNNDTLCIDGKSSVCQNGVWGDGVVCLDYADCQNGKKCGVCSGNSEKCQDGKKYTCSEGLWGTGVTCSNGASCKDATNCGVCANNATRCSDDASGVGQFSTCQSGGWSSNTVCPGSASCLSDNKTCGVCKNGNTKCENGKQYTCVKGVWSIETSCVNGCGVSGIACAPSDVCTNGSVKCESGVKYTCSNNSWGQGVSCNASCKNATECGECTDNDKKCENYKEYTCSGGLWGNGNPCPNGCSSLTRQCAECSPDSTKCDGNNLKNCQSNGSWSAGTHCDNGCIESGGAHCATCATGSKQCTDSGSVGKTKTCTNGEWPSTSQNCTNNFSCKSSTDCGDCQNGAQKCESNNEYQCANGKWGSGTPCGKGCSSDGIHCANCIPESKKCDSDGESTCQSDGTWKVTKPCSYGCADDVCADCSNGAQKCEQGSEFECQNGFWQPTTSCTIGCVGNVCAKCSGQESKCYDRGSYGQYQQCSNGQWSSLQNCHNDYSCKNSTACGDCSNNAKKCVNNVAYVCQNGLWGEGQACTLGCNSSTQACIKCESSLMVTADSGVNSTIPCVTGDVEFAEDATIFDYRALTEIGGNVGLGATVSLKTINLPKLETVGGIIAMTASSLTSFDMPLLKMLGGLELAKSQITKLNIASLLNVKGDFLIYNNPKLTSINLDIKTMGDVNSELQFVENKVLSEIMLKNLNKCPGFITIVENESLKDVQLGCAGELKTVTISINNKLSSFVMPDVTKIEYLQVADNTALSTLRFSNIQSIEYLEIIGENSLGCDDVCPLMKKSKNIFIEGVNKYCDCGAAY